MSFHCTVNYSQNSKVLIDNGCLPEGFIDLSLARAWQLPLVKLKQPRYIDVPVKKKGPKPQTEYMTILQIQIGDHSSEVCLYVAKMSTYPIILGRAWLDEHDPVIGWKNGSMRFESPHCLSHCCQEGKSTSVYALGHQSRGRCTDSSTYINNKKDAREVSARYFLKLASMGAKCYEIRMSHPKDIQVSAASVSDIEKTLAVKEDMTDEKILQRLPYELHEFLDVFQKRRADELPPLRPGVDHHIKIENGVKELPFKRPYPMTRDELEVVRRYVNEHLEKGFIRTSSSSTAAPVLLAHKPGGGLRFCVDYRALNAITEKMRYPIPRVSETLSRLSKSEIYTKLDVISAFNRIRVREGDEHLTAFTTRFGQFEYLVMPFGLCNAPATFQSFINDSLREYLDDCCTAYIDDILIYGSREEHLQRVKQVLKKLREANLQLDIRKCEFMQTEVKYLGLIISNRGVRMDPEKLEAIKGWRSPTSQRDVRSFIGFASFYRRFIRSFSALAHPLTELTKGSRKDFRWNDKAEHSFQSLKESFLNVSILTHFDYDRPSVVETDASDFCTAGVLSQRSDDGVLRPVAFFSKKMSPQEVNYDIYDKELLAIIKAFEEWRPELVGSQVQVLTDHKNLEPFMSNKRLNRRQVRWAQFLAEFDFKISYRPGKQGTKPDSLTRRSDDLPNSLLDDRIQHQFQTIIQPSQLSQLSVRLSQISDEESEDSEIPDAFDFDQDILEKSKSDPIVLELIRLVEAGERRTPKAFPFKISLNDCKVYTQDGQKRLLVGGRVFVPGYEPTTRLKVLQAFHDSPLAGHMGRKSTYRSLLHWFFWPNMRNDVTKFVRCCHLCKRTKAVNEQKQGLLRSLEIPNGKGRHWSVDYIVDLPVSQGCKNILVWVDRLTKRKRFLPVASLDKGKLVTAFIDVIVRNYGVPESIVSDRGSQFTSETWKRLMSKLGISKKMSTAYHPETDGQTEIANANLKRYLRAYTNYAQSDWAKWLPLAELAINSHESETTGISPMLAEIGYQPKPFNSPAAPTGTSPTKSDYLQRTADITKLLKDEINWAQATQKDFADRDRQPEPLWKIGDLAWLDARNITTERKKSLDYKTIGPFRIKRVLDGACELELPTSMGAIHPVFNVSLLHFEPGE